MGAVVIRNATIEDWPAIWSFLHEIVARETPSPTTRTWTSPQRARCGSRPRPSARWLRSKGDGTVVGSAQIGPNHAGPGAHVASASFMVDPAHWGKGIGRALAEHAVEWARGEGYRAMQFNAVSSTNTHAIALYRSLGFEVLATIPDGFQHPAKGYVGLHIMYRRL
jgi:L-amino acid N-acyltransferase YncA